MERISVFFPFSTPFAFPKDARVLFCAVVECVVCHWQDNHYSDQKMYKPILYAGAGA